MRVSPYFSLYRILVIPAIFRPILRQCFVCLLSTKTLEEVCKGISYAVTQTEIILVIDVSKSYLELGIGFIPTRW